MNRFLALSLILFASLANAGSTLYGSVIRYFGTGTNANDVLFTTGSMIKYSACTLMSTTGAVQVFVSLDGTTFSTAPLTLVDDGSTTPTTNVLLTAPLRVYNFPSVYMAIKVTQNGATASAASMDCQ